MMQPGSCEIHETSLPGVTAWRHRTQIVLDTPGPITMTAKQAHEIAAVLTLLAGGD